MRFQIAILALAAAVSALAAPLPRPRVGDKVKDRFLPASYEAQRIEGFLADRMRVNLEQRLLRVDEKALLAGFQNRPGSHPWIGEHIGKFLHAGVNSWRLTGDQRLKTLLDRMVRELIATQLPDGYLGTYTDDQRWTSWDVWVHKYNLIGLLSYYEATGYAPALEASRKIGDLLVRTFGDEPGKRDIIAASTHVGMAASSVLEPVCQLYRWTGEKRYLAFARYIVRSWDQENGPKIVRSLLEHGNVHKTANAKAYEMMSCLVGLLELYRLTGERSYLLAAENAWKDITARRLYITGTTSSHEHFQDEFHLPGGPADDVGEGCATVTWLQLNWHLLRLSADRKYAEQIERTVYNQLLAAQDPASGNICYFTPLIGYKPATPGINCCVSSEPRGISMIPQFVWGTGDNDTIYVFQYAPGTLKLGDASLTVKTEFPASGKVTIAANTRKKTTLEFRVPEWAGAFTLTYRGNELRGKPGERIQVADRFDSATPVEIEMDMTVRTVDGGRSYPGHVAVQRGPQVLALDADANPALAYIHRAALKSAEIKALGKGKYTAAGVALTREGTAKDQDLTLIPFSEAAWYRVWIPKPNVLPQGPASLTAYARESVSRGGRVRGSFTDESADTYAATDARGTGEHWFGVEMRAPQQIGRIVFRHGKSQPEGGWFTSKPRVEIKRSAASEWESAGVLESYAAGATTPAGTAYEWRPPKPLSAAAIRVIGPPSSYATCAELAAY